MLSLCLLSFSLFMFMCCSRLSRVPLHYVFSLRSLFLSTLCSDQAEQRVRRADLTSSAKFRFVEQKRPGVVILLSAVAENLRGDASTERNRRELFDGERGRGSVLSRFFDELQRFRASF